MYLWSLIVSTMERLKKMLSRDAVRGVLLTHDGEVVEFHNPGVKDLYVLVASRPHVLEGAHVADRVIGRGAALLLALGKVEEVFAQVISSPAVQVLNDAEITVDYDTLVPNIINRDGTDMCPVEKLTMNITDPEEAFIKIKEFLTTNNEIFNTISCAVPAKLQPVKNLSHCCALYSWQHRPSAAVSSNASGRTNLPAHLFLHACCCL